MGDKEKEMKITKLSLLVRMDDITKWCKTLKQATFDDPPHPNVDLRLVFWLDNKVYFFLVSMLQVSSILGHWKISLNFNEKPF